MPRFSVTIEYALSSKKKPTVTEYEDCDEAVKVYSQTILDEAKIKKISSVTKIFLRQLYGNDRSAVIAAFSVWGLSVNRQGVIS